MKKVVLCVLLLAAAGSAAFAVDLMSYSPSLSGGDILIDAGVGYAFASDSGASIKIPPLMASVEYCLPSIPISVGGLVGFYQYAWDYSFLNWEATWTYITAGARGNWHWNLPVSWLDLYTGIFVGYCFFNVDTPSSPYSGYVEPSYGGFEAGGQVGAHFYFTKNIGAVVEVGYPFIAKAGIALKF